LSGGLDAVVGEVKIIAKGVIADTTVEA